MRIPYQDLKALLEQKGEAVLGPFYADPQIYADTVILTRHGPGGKIQPMKYPREEVEEIFWSYYAQAREPIPIDGDLTDFPGLKEFTSDLPVNGASYIQVERNRTLVFSGNRLKVITGPIDRQAKIALATDTARTVFNLDQKEAQNAEEIYKGLSPDELFEVLKFHLVDSASLK